jgi:hypothetical protein
LARVKQQRPLLDIASKPKGDVAKHRVPRL